jgi:hypothetical protein
MKLPKHFRYMTDKYKVGIGKTGKSEGNVKNWGWLRHKDMSLRVNKKLCNATFKHTFMHEIVHAIDIHAGIGLTEGQIDAVAYGIIEVINKNDWFPEYFKK